MKLIPRPLLVIRFVPWFIMCLTEGFSSCRKIMQIFNATIITRDGLDFMRCNENWLTSCFSIISSLTWMYSVANCTFYTLFFRTNCENHTTPHFIRVKLIFVYTHSKRRDRDKNRTTNQNLKKKFVCWRNISEVEWKVSTRCKWCMGYMGNETKTGDGFNILYPYFNIVCVHWNVISYFKIPKQKYVCNRNCQFILMVFLGWKNRF